MIGEYSQFACTGLGRDGAALTRDKARITVKFEALAGIPPGRIAPVFGVRVVRTKDL